MSLPTKPMIQELRDPKKLRVLAAPLALQLLNALQGQSEATAAELAQQVGRPREIIYYHLHRLVVAGFIRKAGPRATGRRPVDVYQAVATDVRISVTDPTTDWQAALVGIYRTALRALERDVRAGIEAGHRPGRGPAEPFVFLARRLRLDEEGLRELNARLAAVTEAVLRRATARNGPVYSIGFALAPVGGRRNAGSAARPARPAAPKTKQKRSRPAKTTTRPVRKA